MEDILKIIVLLLAVLISMACLFSAVILSITSYSERAWMWFEGVSATVWGNRLKYAMVGCGWLGLCLIFYAGFDAMLSRIPERYSVDFDGDLLTWREYAASGGAFYFSLIILACLESNGHWRNKYDRLADYSAHEDELLKAQTAPELDRIIAKLEEKNDGLRAKLRHLTPSEEMHHPAGQRAWDNARLISLGKQRHEQMLHESV